MNHSYPWSILGVDQIGSSRRLRNLHLLPIIREFNDLAVPRMGGVWFAKQIYLSCLGIAAAENVRKQQNYTNIQVTNAIEALACKIALDNNPNAFPVKGKRKLPNVQTFSFSNLKKPGVYVTQPWRMSTVQCLPALGLTSMVNRFNDFTLEAAGHNLIYTYDDNGARLVTALSKWVLNRTTNIKRTDIVESISPVVHLNSGQKKLIHNLIERDERRCAVMEWSRQRQAITKWEKKPPRYISESHWKDMFAGAEFSAFRSKIIDLLNAIENQIHTSSKKKMLLSDANKLFQNNIRQLAFLAEAYLSSHEDPTTAKGAHEFCKECIGEDQLLGNLIIRDGICLILEDKYIVPGPAFEGRQTKQADDSESDPEDYDPDYEEFPPNISFRVPYMFKLQNDLKYRGQK